MYVFLQKSFPILILYEFIIIFIDLGAAIDPLKYHINYCANKAKEVLVCNKRWT